MNDVVVTAPNLASAQRSPHSLAIIASVSDPPKSLVALPEGHILQGIVTGHDAKGRLLVRTDFGVLTIHANQKIAVGSQLTLEVRSVGPRVHVLLLQVTNGGPVPAPSAARHSIGIQASTLTASGGLTPGPDSISVGQSLRAVLQTPPVSGAGLPPELVRLTPGAGLTLRVTAVGVPTQAPATPAGAAPGASNSTPSPAPAPTTAGAPSPQGQTPGFTGQPPVAIGGSGTAAQGTAVAPAPPPQAPSGHELASLLAKSGIKDVAATQTVTPPRGATQALTGQAGNVPLALSEATASSASTAAGQPRSAAASAPAAQGLLNPQTPQPTSPASGPTPHFTGLVTALSRTGEPILHTPLGTISLDLRAPIPVGSSLAFQVLSSPAAQSSPASAESPAPWNALGSFLANLDADPALRDLLLQRVFPQTGPRLTSGLLLFLSALKGGSIEGWLGAYGPLLDQARRAGSLDRLRSGLPGLSRLVEGNGGEWRLFLIPLLQGGSLQPLRLYLRKNDQEDEGNSRQRKPMATRFVLDVELSRLGGVQLDGLVRPKTFDLVLRSGQALSEQARQHVTEIFQAANAASGLTGWIAFQSTKDRQVFEETGEAADHHSAVMV